MLLRRGGVRRGAPIVDCSNIANPGSARTTPDQCRTRSSASSSTRPRSPTTAPARRLRTATTARRASPGAEFPVGTTTVIWTVTDASGKHTATCSEQRENRGRAMRRPSPARRRARRRS
ncbi:MAG: HYR domain-containing protein [Saprospiraceae bacterium]|nr:HYR domain-containing protein [Saprospiraceae bacterium]